MVILDGREVDESVIDKTKHIFIGTFRHPSFAAFRETLGKPGSYDAVECTCGHGLWTVEEAHEHWLLGHFDIPVYQTIGGSK